MTRLETHRDKHSMALARRRLRIRMGWTLVLSLGAVASCRSKVPQILPSTFLQVGAGMTKAEILALGSELELTDQDRTEGRNQKISRHGWDKGEGEQLAKVRFQVEGAEPLDVLVRFAPDGKLLYLNVSPPDRWIGPPTDLDKVLQMKAKRKSISDDMYNSNAVRTGAAQSCGFGMEEVEDVLGTQGVQVGRTVERETVTDLWRWSVVKNGQTLGQLEVKFRKGCLSGSNEASFAGE